MSYRVSSQDQDADYAAWDDGSVGATHDRRGHVKLRPLTVWAVASLLVLLALWSATSAAYFVFRDDVLAGLISRQADMQYVYEDRIAELRGQMDRLVSRQLLDQEQVEQRVEQLARRQAKLEERAAMLSNLPGGPAAASAKHRPGPRAEPTAAPKPIPLNEPVATPPASDRQSSLRQRRSVAAMLVHVAQIEEALDRVEAHQSATLLAMEDSYGAKVRRMRGVLLDLGLDPRKVVSAETRSGVGGPFVPVPSRGDANAFDRQVQRVMLVRAHVERLDKTLVTVPVRSPLAGELDTSSGFGVRMDPFVRAPAMHSGLDFRASPGEPVRATAAGTVVTTGWNGGYGRMIEIDHGNGFSTRYAHLSAILVKEDQVIRPGQIIGRVGSTGRSTGPHLHYETRIDGEAVDPHRFLRAGLRLGAKF
jgi:murein DD-endopeptidase MepM/ murein hydrolase activator NlpD